MQISEFDIDKLQRLLDLMVESINELKDKVEALEKRYAAN